MWRSGADRPKERDSNLVRGEAKLSCQDDEDDDDDGGGNDADDDDDDDDDGDDEPGQRLF